MAQIIEDEMCEKLLCSQCKKYLSVFPVKVYADGTIKCGRCCEAKDEGTISLYQSIAQNCLFKCINRYDGCRKTLKTSEVSQHEKICLTKNYGCPKCEHGYKGTIYEMLEHYNSNHSSSILRNNSFSIPIKEKDIVKERYLYLKAYVAFFVLVEYYGNLLYLSTVTLKKYENVKYKFSLMIMGKSPKYLETELSLCQPLDKFYCVDYSQINFDKFSTDNIKCTLNLDLSQLKSYVCEIAVLPRTEKRDSSMQTKTSITLTKGLQTVPIENMEKVELTEAFKKEYSQYTLTPCGTALFDSHHHRIELTCSNCKQFTGCNSFTCINKQHSVCWDCNAWCGICESRINGWNCEISSVNELLLLPCRWKCGKNLSGGSLRKHELECDLFVKTCPLCENSISYSLVKLKTHFSVMHNTSLHLSGFNLVDHLKEKGNIRKTEYFIFNTYLFKLKWLKVGASNYKICINACEITNDYDIFIISENNKYNTFEIHGVIHSLRENPKFYLQHDVRSRNVLHCTNYCLSNM